jgi:membrane protease YdiL (CAAX protease family)
MGDYLQAGRTGRNDWWRYLVSLPTILVIWFVVGAIPVLALLAYVMADGNPETGFSSTGFVGVPVVIDFLANALTFVPFLVATLLAVRFIHMRSLHTLFTGAEHIRWGRMLTGAGGWFVIAAVAAFVESLLYPGRYVLTFQPATLFVYASVALIFIPIQASAEEVFFRGYLLQWMGLRLKNKWILAFLNGVLFFLPHIVNPEMGTNAVLMGLSYFAMGFFLALITLEDNGLELAIGMHAANNLFAVLFANTTITALPSPSLFTIQTLDPVYGLISVVIGMLVFYLIFFWVTRTGTATRPR